MDRGRAMTYDPGVRVQTLFAGLAVTFLAAGCAGGGAAHHPTFTVAQALRQARTDGLSPVRVGDSGSLRCDTRTLEFGPTQTTGRYAAAYQRPSYGIEFSDRRAPPRADVARIGMEVFVFPSARFAARCAQGGIYSEKHAEVRLGFPKLWPYKVISPTTVEIGMHKSDAPGSVRGQTGEYDTYLADGRVVAFGLAYNTHDSQIVQADLAQIAAEIAG
jgi:hypothetical protein